MCRLFATIGTRAYFVNLQRALDAVESGKCLSVMFGQKKTLPKQGYENLVYYRNTPSLAGCSKELSERGCDGRRALLRRLGNVEHVKLWGWWQ